MGDRIKVRGLVEARHGTIHRFCRAHPELNRSTVYMVLAGTYPAGTVARHLERITAALDGAGDRTARIFRAIKSTACARCNTSGPCTRCDALFRAQVRAVEEVFSR